MKRTFITLTLAAQLAASAAFAQTSTTTTGSTETDSSMGTFGGDWSETLGLAIFDADGTTVRSEEELRTQWETLSEEDKDMLRRDCMAYMEQSDDDTAAAGSTTGGTDSSTAPATGTTTGDAASTGTGTPMNVTMEQMEEICEATRDL